VKELKMSVFTKLNQARIKLQNTELTKSGHNKFAGYRYFELGDFLPTVQSIFSDLGLCGIVSYGTDIASLTIVDTEDSSNIVITSPMGSAALKGCHEVQNIGAVETYQRRYLWVTAMEIVEHDAIDSSEGLDDLDVLGADIKEIKTQKTPAELKVAFAKLYKKYQGKPALLPPITNAYNLMKDKFNEVSPGAA
jgi:hypothetical protein